MGNILPRSTSNLEKLGRIVKALNHSEKFYFELQRKRELCVNNLITYGSSLYILIGVLMYMYMWGDDPDSKKLCKCYYILYPVVLIIIKEFIIWVFTIRLDKVTSKLNSLRSQKREVMYAIMKAEPRDQFKRCPDGSEYRVFPNSPAVNPEAEAEVAQAAPQKKRLSEKVSDFVTAESRRGRTALTCSKCGTHNGGVFGEELDYITFKCYICHSWNPARKFRPYAPKPN